MCNRVVSGDHFIIIYCPDRFKIQRICDKAVEDWIAVLKLIPDWVVTMKLLQKFDGASQANDDILIFNEDFDKVTFIANQRHILTVDRDKINFDEDNKIWYDHISYY